MRAPRARLLIGMIIAQTFIRGCLNVLIVVAAFDVLDAGAEAVGYMTAAIGVGGLVGAIGAMALGGRRLAFVFGLALVFWGVPIVLMGPLPDLVVAVLLLAVVGAANSVEDVAVFTLLQRLVPDDVLTSVLGVLWSLAMGGVAVGSVATPAWWRQSERSPPSSPSAQFSRSWRSSRIGGSWRSTGRRPRLPSSS